MCCTTARPIKTSADSTATAPVITKTQPAGSGSLPRTRCGWSSVREHQALYRPAISRAHSCASCSEVRDAYADLILAWTNWQPWILGYFDHPVTNAYTESLNSLFRVMNRLGRGYSFEALRVKILFTEGAHKKTLTRMMVGTAGKKAAPHETAVPAKNFGADITTLTDLIESGKL